ncbi:MAG: nickel pincer cofactor biosynthesis protein LarC [Lachnospiraceae bacterium]|nr:nickel pincer cofactor biosynthesis protein LarC [Lachnospiraceae bacterium]
MKTLYLDLGMGAAGDMLTAALYELLDETRKKSFEERIASLGLEGVTVTFQRCIKCGITGTHADVRINGTAEGEHDHHDHDHDHHHHSSMADIGHIIDSLNVSHDTASKIKEIYKMIAAAESEAHSVPVSDIHFHEVGTADAICDIASVCVLMEMIAPDRVIASPVCTGYGKVRCAHGILPVPAPATANILKGIPMYAGTCEGELCTPTGAALVRFFADDFSGMPVMSVTAIGYGMGTKDFETANCLRAMLGESSLAAADIVELSCNVDDMTGEDIGYATKVFLEEGAADVYTTAIGMKKGRPGTKISVMCHPEERRRFVDLMFKHTTTLGIRENAFGRYVLDRRSDSIDTGSGKVSVKISEGYGVSRRKIEYDDLERIATDRNISVAEARSIASKETDDSKC